MVHDGTIKSLLDSMKEYQDLLVVLLLILLKLLSLIIKNKRGNIVEIEGKEVDFTLEIVENG